MDSATVLWSAYPAARQKDITFSGYIEQLTYLLYISLADKRRMLPDDCSWQSLLHASDRTLPERYSSCLESLKQQPGVPAILFHNAVSRFSVPAALRKVIAAVDASGWAQLDEESRADVYEELLDKAAAEGKKGIGLSFTPRVLIESICRLIQPDLREDDTYTLCDPAAGTGGFLIGALTWLRNTVGRNEAGTCIQEHAYSGSEALERVSRLANMNLWLHGLAPVVQTQDVIHHLPGSERYNCILSHLPFDTRGGTAIPIRPDFPILTPNKQLNLLLHIHTLLKPGGRAAVVVPDNCLLDFKAGEIFSGLMRECNLHTLLRLPRGTFMPYSQGTKGNILFLQKGRPTEALWVYDARSNVPRITRKTRPLTARNFAEFEKCYGSDPNGGSPRIDQGPNGRFRRFTYEEIERRGFKLDISWLEDELIDDADQLPEPQDLATEAISQLEAIVDDLREIVALIEVK